MVAKLKIRVLLVVLKGLRKIASRPDLKDAIDGTIYEMERYLLLRKLERLVRK
jgi:hypothetical protein